MVSLHSTMSERDRERCDGRNIRNNECAEVASTARGYRPPSREKLSGGCGTWGLSEGPGNRFAELQTEYFHERTILDDSRGSCRHTRRGGGGRGRLAKVGQGELRQGTWSPLSTQRCILPRSGDRRSGAAGRTEERRRLKGVHCVGWGSKVASSSVLCLGVVQLVRM